MTRQLAGTIAEGHGSPTMEHCPVVYHQYRMWISPLKGMRIILCLTKIPGGFVGPCVCRFHDCWVKSELPAAARYL
ncbi:hypothetical protein [Paenarthrobacter sp. YIM B13468]|uniref:hypothetical protein n=1 Tax=Paenarthrobacter sp. YIM B13468 TaxID=3366295 RepID=UPI00366A5FA0